MPSVFSRPNRFKGLSYHSTLDVDMGYLVPCYRQEVVPGDEFKVSADTVVRLAPMLAPIFGEINLWIHFFFVPNRLLWTGFEDFITHGLENGVSTAVHPYIKGDSYNTAGGVWTYGSLADYLGVPVTGGTSSLNAVTNAQINALPFRAYNKIYNDWYRNEFLDSAAAMSTSGGNDSSTNKFLLKRNWNRDYFTSSLPFRQLGNPVTLGFSGEAPVVADSNKAIMLKPTTDTATPGTGEDEIFNDPTIGLIPNSAAGGYGFGSQTGLKADLSQLSARTINDIRTAFQLQRIMERKARSGNRYVEYIASTFGVRSPDARLQRAEFLGGGRAPIMVSEVLQTSAATSTSPQGNMSGHGFGASRTFAFNKAFTEHGWILGILSVMPTPSYFQGLPRDLIKDTWTDYLQPELSHLGEQAIYEEEVVNTLANKNARTVWGYQPMYENYRRRLNEVHGSFRGNMNYWTLSRVFTGSVPGLNASFVDCDASGIQSNIFAAGAQATRPIWIEMNFNVRAIRPLPKHGNPGLVDH